MEKVLSAFLWEWLFGDFRFVSDIYELIRLLIKVSMGCWMTVDTGIFGYFLKEFIGYCFCFGY